MAALEAKEFILDTYNPTRTTPSNMSIKAERTNLILPPTPTTKPNIITPSQVAYASATPNGGVVVGFAADQSKYYVIQYSDNNLDWKTSSPPHGVASCYNTQWFDNGPPKTISKPTASFTRVYRVLEVDRPPTTATCNPYHVVYPYYDVVNSGN